MATTAPLRLNRRVSSSNRSMAQMSMSGFSATNEAAPDVWSMCPWV